MHKITPRSVRVTTVDVEEQNITYSECVSVALVIQHSMRMRCINTVISGLSGFTLVFRINLTVDVEEQNITYSECMSVALAIQHAMRMRCINTVISGLSGSTLLFSH